MGADRLLAAGRAVSVTVRSASEPLTQPAVERASAIAPASKMSLMPILRPIYTGGRQCVPASRCRLNPEASQGVVDTAQRLCLNEACQVRRPPATRSLKC
jgi:hypothetical protein